MADLIDRQAAIDAVRKCPVKEVTPAFMLVDKAEVMTELMMLPSAQPELATDCISKQAAIDALTDQRLVDNMDSVNDTMLHKTKRAAQRILASLPSAQPERKRGKWIPVTNGRGGHECDQCHNYAPAWATGEERLTDFCPCCGADMREGVE